MAYDHCFLYFFFILKYIRTWYESKIHLIALPLWLRHCSCIVSSIIFFGFQSWIMSLAMGLVLWFWLDMGREQRDSFSRSSVGHLVDDAHNIWVKYASDPLFLQNSHPLGITLVSSVLTGRNYLSWSRL